jgi:hypothetical protein
LSVLPVGFGSAAAGGTPAGAVERSLRFNSADSAYLNRTFTTPTNAKKFTISAWVKITSPSGSLLDFSLLSGANSSEIIGVSGVGAFGASVNNRLIVRFGDSNLVYYPQLFRDVSAWAHIVVAIDTDQATQSDRAKFYYNGVLQTATSSTITSGYSPALNTAATRYIGGLSTNAGYYANGYLAEYNFVDGQALTPSDFGETDSATGVWKPKAYSGTYGTNGFYLKFADNSGTTSTTLGKDSSVNGNNWTPNNFSVTAGAGNDSMVDSPTAYGTDTGVGGEVRGNYCTLNPIDKDSSTVTLTNGNLSWASGAPTYNQVCRATIAVTSGKWYWEVTPLTNGAWANMGVANALGTLANASRLQPGGWVYQGTTGNKMNNNSSVAYGATYTNNDVIGVALDMDGNTLTFYKNGVSQGVAYSSGFSGNTISPLMQDAANDTTAAINFGQRAFAYTAPSGFKALCTQNLTYTHTIGATSTTQANDYFNVVTYTGNGSNPRTITGVGFQPDLVWGKTRNQIRNHCLFDAVRGVGSTSALFSNLTDAEGGGAGNQSSAFGCINAFTSDGFTVNAGTTNNNYWNTNNDTYVGWAWNAGGSNATNTSGTITSTVRANTTSGFSIATYTGNGSGGATVGHGLGVSPAMIFIKSRSNSTNWMVWHQNLTANYAFEGLNTTGAEVNGGSPSKYVRSVSSTLVTIGNDISVNQSASYTYVMYCFAPVAGYSAFGSYTANNSADGVFVYLGFRPEFLMIKRSSSSGNSWGMFDTTRSTYNATANNVWANQSYAENSTVIPNIIPIDILSNGFKLRTDSSEVNGTGTYIYAAFAETPFKYALAR